MALSSDKQKQLEVLVAKGGLSNRAIAKEIGCDPKTVRNYIRNEFREPKQTKYDIEKSDKNGCIYIIQADNTKFFKIGVASNVGRRLKNLQTAHYQQLRVVRTFYSEDAYMIEREIHKQLKSDSVHVRGEWFRLDSIDLEMIEEFVYGII